MNDIKQKMEKSIDDIMTQFKQIEGENSGGVGEKTSTIFSSMPSFSTKNGLRLALLLLLIFMWCTVLLMIFRPNIVMDDDNKIIWKYLFLYNLLLMLSLLIVIGVGIYIAYRFIK